MRAHRLLLAALAILVVAIVAFWIWKPVGPTAEDAFRVEADMAGLHKVRNTFLKGDWKEGFALLEPYKQRQFSPQDKQLGVLAAEVHRIVKMVNGALAKAKRAGELFGAGQHEEAAKLMAEAAREYPENDQFRFTADYYEGIVAFDRKDYDLYLRLAEDNVRRNPGGPTAMMWLANARATKYAVSGAAPDKALAEEALVKAEGLARSAVGGDTVELTRTLDRIRFRIETRQIVDPQEYDRRAARPQPGGRN